MALTISTKVASRGCRILFVMWPLFAGVPLFPICPSVVVPETRVHDLVKTCQRAPLKT